MNLYKAIKDGDVLFSVVPQRRRPMEARDVAMIYEAVKDDHEAFYLFLGELSVEEKEMLHDYQVEKIVHHKMYGEIERVDEVRY